ncbi:hypothetical protein [Prosthecobacter dejongeii]|uniref:Putative delta-60 repeat protein n=1 Tax=Prosthecobacter dejongeii TaxID=48465 RepID=A0A7W7YMB3_9BACT|nr:hypothetical protein [Prosthecobacter dejongeii]MBB5038622.1 putative delta-60 repeat protein [Prosthecobacter dejongeii]
MRIYPYFVRLLAFLAVLMVSQHPAQGQVFALGGGSLLDVHLATLTGQKAKANTLEVLPTGEMLLAGQLLDGSGNQKMIVSRLLANGQLDTNFGTSGFFTFSENTQPFTVRALALQSSGKIIVAGDAGSTYYILRLTAQGTLDNTFAITRFSHASAATLTDVVSLANGRIIVSGNAVRTGAADLDAELFGIVAGGGSVDTSFGTSGRYVYGGSSDQTVTSLQVQADGRVLYAGSTSNGAFAYVGRLSATGVTDTNFANFNGRLLTSTTGGSASNNQGVRALALDVEQNIVAAVTSSPSSNEMGVMRFTPTGALDTTFSNDGIHTFTFGSPSWVPGDVLVQRDGRIIIAAHVPGQPNTSQIRLRRLEWNGQTDSSFGGTGDVTYTLGSGGNLLAGLRDDPANNYLFIGTTRVGTDPLDSMAVLRVLRGNNAPVPGLSILSTPPDRTLQAGQNTQIHADVAVLDGVAAVYSWYCNNTLLARTQEPSYSFSAQGSHEGTWRLEVTGQGPTQRITQTSAPFQITVSQPPVLSLPPPGRSQVFIGTFGYSSYLYSGRLPATCKVYTDGEVVNTFNINGNYITFSLFENTPATRTHHIVVTNADGEIRSDDFVVDYVNDPYIQPHNNLLISLGETFQIAPTIFTNYEWRSSWKLNGKALPLANTVAEYTVGAATFADAGTYSFTARTITGSYTRDIRVAVMDSRPRNHQIAVGRKFKLTIPIVGSGLTYSWTHNGEPLEARPGLSGVDSPTLTFASPTAADEGSYACTARFIPNELGANELTCAEQTLTIVSAVPTLEAFTLEPAQIGLFYQAELPLPEQADRFTVKGLPSGFSYDPISHILSGTPTKSGRYTLTFTAVNPLGSSAPVKVLLEVPTLPTGTYGRFYGTLFDGVLSSVIDVTITPDGRFTGKVSASNHAGRSGHVGFTGSMVNGQDLGTSSSRYHGTARLALTSALGGSISHDGPSTFHFQVENGGFECYLEIPYTSPENGSGVQSLSGNLIHCPYSSKAPLDAGYRGIFNLGFDPADGSDSRPGGSSFTRATVSSSGVFSQVGKLADGTTLTSSAPVNQDFTINSLRHLYGNRGGILYTYSLNPGSQGPDYLNASISGSFTWIKTAASYTGQKNYPIEINTTVALNACGKYLKPNHPSGLTGPLMLNTNVGADNLYLSTLGVSVYTTLRKDHSVVIPPDLDGDSFTLKSIKFNPATGHFSATGSLVILVEETYDPETDTYKSKYRRQPYNMQGLIIREPNSLSSFGLGYGLVPETFLRPDTEQLIRLNRSYAVDLRSAF